MMMFGVMSFCLHRVRRRYNGGILPVARALMINIKRESEGGIALHKVVNLNNRIEAPSNDWKLNFIC